MCSPSSQKARPDASSSPHPSRSRPGCAAARAPQRPARPWSSGASPWALPVGEARGRRDMPTSNARHVQRLMAEGSLRRSRPKATRAAPPRRDHSARHGCLLPGRRATGGVLLGLRLRCGSRARAWPSRAWGTARCTRTGPADWTGGWLLIRGRRRRNRSTARPPGTASRHVVWRGSGTFGARVPGWERCASPASSVRRARPGSM